MEWQASIEDRGAVITFRGLTRQSSPDAPICEAFHYIRAGQTWGRRSFEEWLTFLRARGGSTTVGFDGAGAIVEVGG
jgi:hypothetical protein